MENKKREVQVSVSFGGQSLGGNGHEESGIATVSKGSLLSECISCVTTYFLVCVVIVVRTSYAQGYQRVRIERQLSKSQRQAKNKQDKDPLPNDLVVEKTRHYDYDYDYCTFSRY